ncbi:hypothetical protein BIV57_02840 [Mangrovactinospora gilvigrisea]|uniref:DUF3180 domain-containing protein n=1 Tax=Mangrovactinospora gilvigrisea TaxID=1428644 RepID=A0A1J7BZK9_9ACTN|nr:DUF3180 domain-containing protein [Mangrovactinospora gilvigrisea]OIV38921.1 hypothetical protein BIV57_02840 [Mangrovactinospora gilvigrisea]
MRPLRTTWLIGTAVLVGALSWAGSKLWDSMGSLPGVPVAAPVVLFLIAVVLFATGMGLRTRLQQQRDRVPGAKGVDPMVAARAVVFGHASAIVAALVAGIYGGMGVFLVTSSALASRHEDAYLAGASVLGAVAVVLAAFFVQRVCKLPDDGEGEDAGAPR